MKKHDQDFALSLIEADQNPEKRADLKWLGTEVTL
jgi:hypothetical protein